MLIKIFYAYPGFLINKIRALNCLINHKKFCINRYSQKQKRIFKMTVLDLTLTHDQFLYEARKFRRAEKRKLDKVSKEINALDKDIRKAEKAVNDLKIAFVNIRRIGGYS